MIVAGKLDEPRARDPLGQVAPSLGRNHVVARSMRDDGRHVDGGQHAADVVLHVHPAVGGVGTRLADWRR